MRKFVALSLFCALLLSVGQAWADGREMKSPGFGESGYVTYSSGPSLQRDAPEGVYYEIETVLTDCYECPVWYTITRSRPDPDDPVPTIYDHLGTFNCEERIDILDTFTDDHKEIKCTREVETSGAPQGFKLVEYILRYSKAQGKYVIFDYPEDKPN